MEDRYSIAQLLDRMRANWPQSATRETEVILGLFRLGELINDRTEKIVAGFNLSLASFEVLATLRSHPAPHILSPTDLYKSVMITSGGMTKVLKHLEANSWVVRLDNDQDRRSKLVQLTEAGARQAEESMMAVTESDRALFSTALDGKDLESLREILSRAVPKLEQDYNSR